MPKLATYSKGSMCRGGIRNPGFKSWLSHCFFICKMELMYLSCLPLEKFVRLK